MAKPNPFIVGVGFCTLSLVDDDNYLVISNYLVFEGSSGNTKSYKEMFLETTQEDKLLIMDAPSEFKEEIKSIIDK